MSQSDLDKLFGAGYKLRTLKELSQPGQFAANETIKIVGPKNEYANIRIIGPVRNQTQLEITITDSFFLGIKIPPILESGNYNESFGGLKIIGPRGEIGLEKGIIVAQRHLHISPDEAKELKVRHHDLISIKTTGVRSIIFNNVMVRSLENVDKLSFQLDTDEANAAEIKTGDFGEII